MDDYSDIIDRPYHGVSSHRPMSMEGRAAQFAPFAALTGHNAAIEETARLTSGLLERTPEQLQELSRKLAYAISLPRKPEITITYFVPDSRKSGGAYVQINGKVKKVEVTDTSATSAGSPFNRLILTDNTEIPLDSVYDITGDIFKDLE